MSNPYPKLTEEETVMTIKVPFQWVHEGSTEMKNTISELIKLANEMQAFAGVEFPHEEK